MIAQTRLVTTEATVLTLEDLVGPDLQAIHRNTCSSPNSEAWTILSTIPFELMLHHPRAAQLSKNRSAYLRPLLVERKFNIETGLVDSQIEPVEVMFSTAFVETLPLAEKDEATSDHARVKSILAILDKKLAEDAVRTRNGTVAQYYDLLQALALSAGSHLSLDVHFDAKFSRQSPTHLAIAKSLTTWFQPHHVTDDERKRKPGQRMRLAQFPSSMRTPAERARYEALLLGFMSEHAKALGWKPAILKQKIERLKLHSAASMTEPESPDRAVPPLEPDQPSFALQNLAWQDTDHDLHESWVADVGSGDRLILRIREHYEGCGEYQAVITKPAIKTRNVSGKMLVEKMTSYALLRFDCPRGMMSKGTTPQDREKRRMTALSHIETLCRPDEVVCERGSIVDLQDLMDAVTTITKTNTVVHAAVNAKARPDLKAEFKQKQLKPLMDRVVAWFKPIAGEVAMYHLGNGIYRSPKVVVRGKRIPDTGHEFMEIAGKLAIFLEEHAEDLKLTKLQLRGALRSLKLA
jgi:hypothetical protein